MRKLHIHVKWALFKSESSRMRATLFDCIVLAKIELTFAHPHRSLKQQESPPAWTQESYRPHRIKYSICCPIWVVPTLVGGVHTLAGRCLPWLGGTYLGWGVSILAMGWGIPTPARKYLPWASLVPPPPRVWTDWKHNLPSRTTYAVGKKILCPPYLKKKNQHANARMNGVISILPYVAHPHIHDIVKSELFIQTYWFWNVKIYDVVFVIFCRFFIYKIPKFKIIVVSNSCRVLLHWPLSYEDLQQSSLTLSIPWDPVK